MAASRLTKLKVADLMSAPTALPATSTVRDAAMLFARAGTSVAPVVSAEGAYSGVLGEADIHRRLSQAAHGFYPPEEFRTGVPLMVGRLPDAMWEKFARVGWVSVGGLARRIQVVDPEDPVPVALEAMRRNGLSVLPVVEGGEIVGILHLDAVTLRLAELALYVER